jgi:UDP-N-acetylmuramoylalanine--D-glutamate ligase
MINNFSNKKIGIWGYGKVGKSVAEFVRQQGATVGVMDKSRQELPAWITFYDEENKDLFFAIHDYIVPSPGIDITPYLEKLGTKLIAELDLFAQFFHKPIIAITGSVGKTTTTSLLGQLLNLYGIKALVGGNIGIACCDLISMQDSADCAVLEVSSFQTEHCRLFAPDVAIITNLVPNHLDRHITMEAYRSAKLRMILNQTAAQKALLPESFKECAANIKSSITFFNASAQPKNELPLITFTSNWVVIEHALALLNCDISQLPTLANSLKTPEHRLEHIARIHDVDFYNDSKATTPTSTLSAVAQLKHRPIHLLLGGLSKGINRESLIHALHGSVKTIACFGAEAEQLWNWCTASGICATNHATLEDAFQRCIQQAEPHDIILLAPGGSSFDLFKDFEERGNVFKLLTYEVQKSYDADKRDCLCIKPNNDSMQT